MSYADKIFVNMCRDILDNGTDTKGEKVRAKWDDGSFAYTIKKFGVVNRYDLKKEFPALTLRKTGFKNCVDELLWIWQKKSNNVNDLNSHIWDNFSFTLTPNFCSSSMISNPKSLNLLDGRFPKWSRDIRFFRNTTVKILTHTMSL